MERYPKRLIEVDLPIKRISAHARREKSIRHGHISTLHIWWARRPLAACRAVICASLWPDPADELCPDAFRETAREQMRAWVTEHFGLVSQESESRFLSIHNDPKKLNDNLELRNALLDFIADFANWDNSKKKEYLETSRKLTQSAHESLGGATGTRPLVVDPFAGGGSIPLEALRVGADAFASDLNPVAVLLNKVVLEYIPKYGQKLADEVRKWGEWIKQEAEKELADFYPKDSNGATPIAYLWARTIKCEGPICGAEVPLMRSTMLAKTNKKGIALQILPNPNKKRIDFELIEKNGDKWIKSHDNTVIINNLQFEGTMRRGAVTCPCCGYTTSISSVRRQLKERNGGADSARLFCVILTHTGEQGRSFRLPNNTDIIAVQKAKDALEEKIKLHEGSLSIIPDEPTPKNDGHRAVGSLYIYGISKWAYVFTSRQLLALITLVDLIKKLPIKKQEDNELKNAIQLCLAFALDKQADSNSSLCAWRSTTQDIGHTFGRQALPMMWDFVEGNIFSGATRDWTNAVEGILKALESLDDQIGSGHIEKASAVAHPLPDDSVEAFITDPPYYDSVPYGDLSDFFYVWLKRSLENLEFISLQDELTPKNEQAIVWHPSSNDERFEYQKKMFQSMVEGRRILHQAGIGVVVFAHKSTSGWETQLQAMVDAGWVVTASWPIDTEMGSRMNAMGTASLASSIHLICRPRHTDEIGDWRSVLAELPKRIHDWMPRLAEEGVVGADAIFACLGPALEIFSRYSHVEKASGETVSLKEYLEQVWAAVAKEALSLIFSSADTAGFEEDARLTAMWLWTLKTADAGGDNSKDEEADHEDDESGKKTKTTGGFALEFDAARKIAQGLGVNLEKLHHLVLLKGETAILLPVSARTKYLFGKDSADVPKGTKKKKREPTLFDFDESFLEKETDEWEGELKGHAGKTILDQLHQSMILFAANRSEALKRFLVEDGIGGNPLYWKLAQSLSALYPTGTDEKRWVDGVLAKKKGFGF